MDMTNKPFTGSNSLMQSLEHEGVETIFGVPGGAILPAYDPLLDSPIRHVLARHEQGGHPDVRQVGAEPLPTLSGNRN
jgi:acetolactate synthase-1/2/3 large subunit